MSDVNASITKAQRWAKGLSSTRALEIVNDTWSELLKRAQFRNSTTTIAMAAGTREYDLSSDVWQIHEAYYEPSSDPNSWTPIYERSTDEYAVYRKGWRANSLQDRPYGYYVTTQTNSSTAKVVIGFDPVPGTSTSGTYPRVKLYTTSYAALVGADTIPTSLLNDKVFVWGMRLGWAEDTGDQAGIQLCAQELENEMRKNIQHIQGFQTHGRDATLVPAVTIRRRII